MFSNSESSVRPCNGNEDFAQAPAWNRNPSESLCLSSH